MNFYLFNTWILKELIKKDSYMENFNKIKILKKLNYDLDNIIKKDFIKLFSSNKNRKILDEIIRNKRVIYFNLDEYYKENYFKRELFDILKQ
jgi:hypothetical protein